MQSLVLVGLSRMDRSIYSLETSIVVQYNVKNNSYIKLGVNIIRMIIKSLNELIKLERKRELNPEYSRRRREIVLHKQSLLLDRYKSEIESILMNTEDSHDRNLIYEYYRLNVLNNIMKSLYYIGFKLVSKQEKLKLSIPGFGKTLVNSLNKVTHKDEVLKCNELCWRLTSVMNYLISCNLLPVEIIKCFDALNNIDTVLFYKYNDTHERHYYLVLVTLLQLIELTLLRRNNSNSTNEEVIANELNWFHIILKDIPKYIALSLKLSKLNISNNYSESIILLHLGIKSLKAYFINSNNIYSVWSAADYEAYDLLNDLHYWNQCVFSNRVRNYGTNSDEMVHTALDFNDIAIGSTLVSDLLYCTSTLLLQLLNQVYNFNDHDGFNNCNKTIRVARFEYDVNPLIFEVVAGNLNLINISLDCHIQYYGYSESTLAKPKVVVDESGATKMKFWLDIQCKSKVIGLLHIDYVLASHIDDEIISMFRYISTSFTSGIIYKNAFYSIVKGYQLCLLRKLNYFIQISWLEATLSFILCFIKNGVIEGESNVNGSVRRDILLYYRELIPIITEIMNYQHLALSIQRIGLLIIRLLIKEPFMTKTDVEDLITTQNEVGVEDQTEAKKKNIIVDSNNDRISIHSDEDDEEEEPDNVIDEKKKTLKGKFYEWYLKTIKKKIEENDIFPTPCFNLVETIVFIGETHIQSSDVLEQLLLLIYQLGVYSNLAKLSMAENGVSRIVQRIQDMQSTDEVYITTLANMCLEVVYVEE